MEAVSFSDPYLYLTAGSIFIAGIFASAAGIGGGGLFVAVLMFAGGFTPHQAVPLSKAMICTGSFISFYLNMRKKHPLHGGSLIDFDVCKMLIPMALCGTVLGVFLNGVFAPWLLVASLFCLLSVVSYRTCVGAVKLRRAEDRQAREPAFTEISLINLVGKRHGGTPVMQGLDEKVSSIRTNIEKDGGQPLLGSSHIPLPVSPIAGGRSPIGRDSHADSFLPPTSHLPSESSTSADDGALDSEDSATASILTHTGSGDAAGGGGAHDSGRTVRMNFSFGAVPYLVVGTGGEDSEEREESVGTSPRVIGSQLSGEPSPSPFGGGAGWSYPAPASHVPTTPAVDLRHYESHVSVREGGTDPHVARRSSFVKRWLGDVPERMNEGLIRRFGSEGGDMSIRAARIVCDCVLLVGVLLAAIVSGVCIHVGKSLVVRIAIATTLFAFALLLQVYFAVQICYCAQVNDQEHLKVFRTPLHLCGGMDDDDGGEATRRKWRVENFVLFGVVAFFTGICSGLLGIGGGLVISPFLVAMDLDPVVTVATAATCVVFTATSTTLQYLYMQRVMIDFAVVFGVCTVAASYVGVIGIHHVAVRFGRKSHVIFVVAAAVVLSSVFSMAKAIHLLTSVGDSTLSPTPPP